MSATNLPTHRDFEVLQFHLQLLNRVNSRLAEINDETERLSEVLEKQNDLIKEQNDLWEEQVSNIQNCQEAEAKLMAMRKAAAEVTPPTATGTN